MADDSTVKPDDESTPTPNASEATDAAMPAPADASANDSGEQAATEPAPAGVEPEGQSAAPSEPSDSEPVASEEGSEQHGGNSPPGAADATLAPEAGNAGAAWEAQAQQSEAADTAGVDGPAAEKSASDSEPADNLASLATGPVGTFEQGALSSEASEPQTSPAAGAEAPTQTADAAAGGKGDQGTTKPDPFAVMPGLPAMGGNPNLSDSSDPDAHSNVATVLVGQPEIQPADAMPAAAPLPEPASNPSDSDTKSATGDVAQKPSAVAESQEGKKAEDEPSAPLAYQGYPIPAKSPNPVHPSTGQPLAEIEGSVFADLLGCRDGDEDDDTDFDSDFDDAPKKKEHRVSSFAKEQVKKLENMLGTIQHELKELFKSMGEES